MSYEAVLTAEALKNLGLDRAPKIKYDDLPPKVGTPDVSQLVNFTKAKLLVDPLLTAKFSRFVPSELIVDQAIDTMSYRREWSVLIHVRTDVVPPVNDLVTRVTGIRAALDQENFMRWLALEMKNEGVRLGTKRIGPPKVFATRRGKQVVPILGVIVKYDRTPADGLKMEDSVADIGVLAPTS